MTDDELWRVLENGGDVCVPYFDGAHVRVEPFDVSPALALPVLKNFLRLTPEQRRSDGRHLLAYCELMIDVVGEEQTLCEMGGVMPTLEDVWQYASPTLIFFSDLDVGKFASTPTVFLQIEGSVAWEPEHGLQMSWAAGSRLVKVGPFDGHPTNGHASGNPEADRHVFRCYMPELCTLPDPT